jgi:hypothetical protein
MELTRRRLLAGLEWGLTGTLVMSLLMIAGVASGLSPMPRPIPEALMVTLLGESDPKLLVLVLAVGAHLLYGAIAGALLALLRRPVTLATGLGWGGLLWAIMGVAVLPLIGWGVFGATVTPRIALATLLLHLVYGAVLSWALDQEGGTASFESGSVTG